MITGEKCGRRCGSILLWYAEDSMTMSTPAATLARVAAQRGIVAHRGLIGHPAGEVGVAAHPARGRESA